MPPYEHPRLCHVCRTALSDCSLERIGSQHKYNEMITELPWHDSVKSFWASQRVGCIICSGLDLTKLRGFWKSVMHCTCEKLDSDGTRYSVGLEIEVVTSTPNLPHDEDYRGQPRKIKDSFLGATDGTEVDWGTRTISAHRFTVPKESSPEMDPIVQAGVEARRSTWTGSRGVLLLARQWLEHCLESHSCRAPDSEVWMPDRLLFLDGKTVRLIDTSSLESAQRYATLSHCWGGMDSLMATHSDLTFLLTDQTEERLRLGLRRCHLPKTFRDACTVTRWLGLRYLWIDSYCIRQRGEGSEDDKGKQIADMQYIYTACTVNIGATSGTDPMSGLFRIRDPWMLQSLPMSWRPSSWLEPAETRIHHGTSSPKRPLLNDSAMMTRGWVFQERILTTRMLHFGHEQIFFECEQTPLVTESSPKTGMYSSYNDWEPYMFSLLHNDGLSARHQDSNWNNILESYTPLQFSNPDQDKLTAIGGVAAHISTASDKGDYIAGLWREELPFDLLWEPNDATTRSKTWRAPSWSWASLDGRINLSRSGQEDLHTTLVHVVSVDIELADPRNPFGAVLSGSITLEGTPLAMEQIQQASINPEDWVHHALREEHYRKRHEYRSCQIGLDGLLLTFDDESEEHANISLLPVLQVDTKLLEDDGLYVYGLVISPAGSGRYRRLGTFEYKTNAFSGLWGREMSTLARQVVLI